MAAEFAGRSLPGYRDRRSTIGFVLVKHGQPVTSVALSDDDLKGFSASKDGTILQWDVNGGKHEKYPLPSEKILKSHGVKESQGRASKHSKHVLALAVSSDGRDRTMQLFKIPEETRIVFRASTASLECCCFINNDEYLTGSDDGSIELWSMLRKKPVCIVKNAHPFLSNESSFADGENGMLPNGHKGEPLSSAGKSMNLTTYSWVSSVAVCSSSDLSASGAGNGFVRLWAIRSETRDIHRLYDLPLAGFVNSLAFASSGKFLVAGVGQEPRLERWR